jgi:hypothetical protein
MWVLASDGLCSRSRVKTPAVEFREREKGSCAQRVTIHAECAINAGRGGVVALIGTMVEEVAAMCP